MKSSGSKTRAILQTGRLGDLWFTVPLADYFAASGDRVEVWYDEQYGDVFGCFPSVIGRPVRLCNVLPGSGRIAIVVNAALKQVYLYGKMWHAGRRIIWNEIYPFQLRAYIEDRPYPDYWYRKYPKAHRRRAIVSLPVANDRTILYFAASLSLRVGVDSPHTAWLESNLERIRETTGYRVLFVPPPGSPDHSRFETWRGDLRSYQELVARCGIVYGIITSAHVLGQLVGKPVVACYPNARRTIDTIGCETIRLYPGEAITPEKLAALADLLN